MFRDGTIADALAGLQFRKRSVHRQFVMPIQLHKIIGSRGFTTKSEHVLDRVGLLRLLGSPVTVCAERIRSTEPLQSAQQ